MPPPSTAARNAAHPADEPSATAPPEPAAPPASPGGPGAASAGREERPAEFRTAVAVVGLSVAALGALLVPALPSGLRAVAVLAFWLTAPGLLLCRTGLLPPVVRLAAVPALGVAALGALSTVTLWAGVWAPVPWSLAAVAGCLLLGLRRALAVGHRGTPRLIATALRRRPVGLVVGLAVGRPQRPGVRVTAQWLLMSAALGSGLATVPALRDAEPTAYGLLAAAPPLYPAAIAATVLAFCLAVRDATAVAARRHACRAGLLRAAAALLVLIALLRLVPALAAEVPSYPWTYKHIGVTEAIGSFGTLVPDADIYHSWPAFFALTAWLTESTGVSALSLAHGITPLVHLLLVLAVAALARSVGLRGPAVLVAAFLAEAVSWVGQDYFAPQSVVLVLGVLTLALALQPREKRAAGWLALACFAVAVPMHQLTPFWVLGALAVLAFLGRVPGRVFWLGLAVTVPYVAAHWEIVESYGVFSSASPLENTSTNAATTESDERAAGQRVFQATALLVWVSAALVLAARAIARRGDVLVPGVLAFSPFVLLLAQNYGGEAVLRVFLFATAGMAVVLAPPLTRLIGAGRAPGRARRLRSTTGPLAASVLLLTATGLAAQSYFTAWFPNRISASQVKVTRTLLDEVPGQAYVAAAGGGWPTRASGGYVRRVIDAWDADLPLLGAVDEEELATARALPPPERGEAMLELIEGSLEFRPAPTFALYAANSYATAEYEDPSFALDLRALHGAMAASERWEEVWTLGDTAVFRYVPEAASGSPAANWTPPDG